MKWRTDWWGVIFTAETDQERELFQLFYAALAGEKASSYYDEGTAELVEKEEGTLELILSR